MGQPWVVVTDPFETQDILRRRTKEFDRSGIMGDVVEGLVPAHHVWAPTSNARFKDNRSLINHLMTPASLSQLSGPQLYSAALSMIEIWKLKSTMAECRPFAAHDDIAYSLLDAIFAAMFGSHPEAESITTTRLHILSRWKPTASDLPFNLDQPFSFPSAPLTPIVSSVLTLAELLGHLQLSPFPRLTSFFMRQLPYIRRAVATKDAYIRGAIDTCLLMFDETANSKINTNNDNNNNTTPTPPATALHSVLLRERSLSLKTSRPPSYHSRAIADEFFGFILVGHDTSAATLSWGVKYLADHPAVQDRLRNDLRAAMPLVAQSKQTPKYADMNGTSVPYLDAVVEEVLRVVNPVGLIVRRALVDTTVLGRRVPKGTDLFFMANGPGYLKGNMEVTDEERSPGARKGDAGNNGLTGTWEDEGIGEFRPERWLKVREDGEEVFDAAAGPSIPFGLGPRGCYGKRFALMALKLQVALIVWHFHLLKVPDELNSYDAVQKVAREPKQCYVRLVDVNS